MNFSCLPAKIEFCSLLSVSAPSSKALKVGEVSSVPLFWSLMKLSLIRAKSFSAFAILSCMIFLNSCNSVSLYLTLSFGHGVKKHAGAGWVWG